MKKVFLDELPRNFRGILWNECIGKNIEFIYDEISGCIEVINFEKGSYLVLKYKDNIKRMKTSDFVKCKIGSLINVISNDFILHIDEVIKDERRHLKIIGHERIKGNDGKRSRYCRYSCMKCGYEGLVKESLLIKGNGCKCCANKVAVLEINTIWDTHKWLVDDFDLDEEFAKTHTYGTGDKGIFTCKYCKEKVEKGIDKVLRDHSVSCRCDSTGYSYPEKIMYSILKQMNFNFICEVGRSSLKWCGDYRYDFYLPSLDMIIETHGLQHYEQISRGRTLKEEQENDRLKRELALSNGIKHYVELDCRYSDLEWIKNSISKSDLSSIFDDLSKVDWLKCEEYALSNICKNICDMRLENPDYTTKKLQELTGYNYRTIRKALEFGAKIGWCKYDPKEETKKSLEKGRTSRRKKVQVIKDGISLGVFESIEYLLCVCTDLFGVQFTQTGISASCRGVINRHKGYNFKYIQ